MEPSQPTQDPLNQNDSSTIQSDTPASTTIPSSTPLLEDPKKSSKKRLLVGFVILILLLAGGGAYAWHTQRQNKVVAAAVHKDIPNIRYVTTNYGWESFYPAEDGSSNYGESNIMIFEGLVRFENKTQIVPLLSTGWSNPDSSTWVFNLRPGVKFHSGRIMTADDVKASFDDAMSTASGQQYASTITSVAVTAPLQITIKTDGPDPTLLKKLTDYYVYDTKSGKAADPINGTGPFTIKPGTVAKSNSLELVAYDQYWGGRPHVRSFSFVGIDNNDHGKAYGVGQSNLQNMFADKPTAVGKRAYTAQEFDQTSVLVMPLNTKRANSPLQKLQVRQAIYLSLDPAAIAKVRLVEATPASQVIPKSVPGFDPTLKRPARDIAKAKQLLTQAGYPNGFSMTFTYFAPSQVTANEIQKELAASGIVLKLDPIDDIKTLAAKANGGQTDAFFNTQASDIFDASDILFNLTGSDNKNYDNPAVDTLIAQANSVLNESMRLGYLKQATRLMSEDLGVVPILSERGDEIIYDPSFVIQRDIASLNLGIYFQKVYAK